MLSKCNNLNVYINNIAIQQTDSVKYLGFIIDSKLKWDVHIDKLCKRVGNLVKYLARLRYFINETNLNLIYKAIILPLFDYADILIDSCDKKYIKKLQTLQNRAGRIIMKVNPYEHISNAQIHSLLKWSSLESRRKKNLNVFVYKSVHNMLSPSMNEMFQPLSHIYSLRNSGNFVLPKPRTEYCRRTTQYRSSIQYNTLPPTTKLLQTVQTFKKYLNNTIPDFL